jgi:FtsZ-binding cell division protein ZapB
MKTRLKVKIAIVLSTSIIINIFLIWEVFRLRDENNKIYKLDSKNSQSLEELWNTNQKVKEQSD